MSFSQGEGERAQWLSRYAAFAVASGLESDKAKSASADVFRNIFTQERAVLTPALRRLLFLPSLECLLSKPATE